VLVGLGQTTWWQFGVSAALMLAAIAAVARIAGGVYGRAILRTGGRVRLRQVFGGEAR